MDQLDNSEAALSKGDVSKSGTPMWVPVGLVAVLLAALFFSQSNGDDAAADPEAATTVPTTSPPADVQLDQNSVDPAVSEPRQFLSHSEVRWSRVNTRGPEPTLVVRAGSTVLVVDPRKELAHRVDLPEEPVTRDGRSVALVSNKLVVQSGSHLRSLSTSGGVDVLLSHSSVGFSVTGANSIVSAIAIKERDEVSVAFVEQGIHYPSSRAFTEDLASRNVELETVPALSVTPRDNELFVGSPDGIQWVDGGPLVPFLGDKVVTVGANHALVKTCDSDGICKARRVALDGSSVVEFPLPQEFESYEMDLSPDGTQAFVLDRRVGEKQVLVSIGEGTWVEEATFAFGQYSSAAFTPGGTLILGQRDSVEFWRGAVPVSVWEFSDIGFVTEIAVAPTVPQT